MRQVRQRQNVNRTSQEWHPKHQGPIGDGTKKPASTTTDWFVPLYPAGPARLTPRKTYRDVDTGVSWDAP